MWRVLKKIITGSFLKAIEKKFIKFLEEVFKGKVGKFLDKYHDEINRAVDVVEDIYNLVTTGETEGNAVLRDIKIEYDIDISEQDVEILMTDTREKSVLKHELAYKLVKRELENKGEEVIDNAVDTGIDLAVARGKE